MRPMQTKSGQSARNENNPILIRIDCVKLLQECMLDNHTYSCLVGGAIVPECNMASREGKSTSAALLTMRLLEAHKIMSID